MGENGIKLIDESKILSYEEIVEVTKTAVSMGINKVRLTGGEPLVRRGIVDLVKLLSQIKGIEDLAMTTNAILLADYAKPLADAGLQRVNISIDAINPEHYSKITGGGDIKRVFQGIEAARKADLNPIKLNCVRSYQSDESDVEAVKKYGEENDLQVRVIRQMNFKTGDFSIVEGGSGGDCPNCNRIRLSSDGKIRPCLFSDKIYFVRKLGPAAAIKAAVANKPEQGTACNNDAMYSIGG